MTAHFELQASETELQMLANEYWEKAGEKEHELEKAAFDAGAAIRYGEYTLGNIETIVRWKAERVVPVLITNSEEKIRRALSVAASPESSLHDAVTALTTLRGVDLPVASAILTAIFPERYAVMDYHSLETLGQPRHDVAFYEEYLAYCRQLAGHGTVQPQGDLPAPTTLRSLERALWQWSKNHYGNGH
jgi:hypothetical protein